MDVRVDSYAWFTKDRLTGSQIASLKNDLTVVPRSYQGEEEPLFLYQENETELGIAREFFYMHRRSAAVVPNWTYGLRDLYTSMGELQADLRQEQQQCLESVTGRLKSEHKGLGGVIRAVPGWGKTVCGLAIAAHYDLPTVVLVHRGFLLDQWEERISQFLPWARVGRAQQEVCTYRGASIVLGMVHSVAAGGYPQEFYDWPGLLIVDECHRMGARTWSPAAGMFSSRYRIGITATPRRKDKAENAFYYHIGPILFAAKEQRLQPKIRRVWTPFKLYKTERFNPNLAPRTLIIKFLLGSKLRNREIALQLVQAVKAGRKCLLVSEQLNHLSKLEEMFFEEWVPEEGESSVGIGYYVGGMSKADLAESAKAQIIFATIQYSAEGLDIPQLDTLFLASPVSDVEQVVGRILRPYPGKKDPIVVDFRDDHVSQFKKQGEKRDAYYDKVTA